MTPEKILNAAIEAVTGRIKNHGSPGDTFSDIAKRWRVTLGVHVTAHQVALCLIDLKIVRANNNPHHMDNAVDIAGYASLLGGLVPPAEQRGTDAAGAVPLVCDFLSQGLAKKGDVLIDNEGGMDTYFACDGHFYYPNISKRDSWSRAGWKYVGSEGRRTSRHIIRIERDGVTVAKRQRYVD